MATTKKKNAFIKAFMGIACLIFSQVLFPYVCANGSGDSYSNNPTGITAIDSTLSNGNQQINSYIEEAAGYFLQAHSDILNFSTLYELADDGIDYTQWQQHLQQAANNLSSARGTYSMLIQIAEITPYRIPILNQLNQFNYAQYKADNNLDSETFAETESFLTSGNITGIYKRIHNSVTAIEAILKGLESDVAAGTKPGIQSVWDINEGFSNTLLFGQYVARVFDELD